MKWTKRSGVELIAIFVMVAVVSILAVYQYRWTGEISRTEQARLKASLAASVQNFDQEFSYDFQRLCEGFTMDVPTPPSELESQVARRYANWIRNSARAGLVYGVSIWKTDSAGAQHLETFDARDNRFHSAAWPAGFESLHAYLTRQREQMPPSIDDREAVYYPWTIYEKMPALVRPLFQDSSDGAAPPSSVRPIGFLIVELSKQFLERQYLPDLADHHFGAAGQKSFVVSIRSAKPPYQTLYQSDPKVSVSASSPDAAVNLIGLVAEEARRRGHPILQASDPDQQWQLVVQHPAGSLDEAVTGWRRRNLAINFGLLAVLAASMGLIFSVARRSKALARQQMEFVAGVSHELCTPLAVINSAAENLVDGVVDGTEQMQEYGGIIRGQGRRLERMVDEVLLFTAGRFGLSGYELAVVEVAPVVAQSLATAEPALQEAGFKLEKDIPDDLPPIVADSSAVITCIENLVSNAMKYGNSNRWIAIRGQRRASSGARKPEVLIIVEDKGIGISAADLPHIFEPFYRVQTVRDNQIRGVGLGLHLVKRMMEDMGGSVSVSSELGRGTQVILHFAVPDSDEHNGAGAG